MDIKHLIRDFIQDESGATAVEYAIMLALIAMAILTALFFLSEALSDSYDASAEAVDKIL